MKTTLQINNNDPVLIHPDRIQAAIKAFESIEFEGGSDPEDYEIDGDVALIKVAGVLARGVEDFEDYGFADYSRIARQVQEASNDARVKTVMLVVDSPGGMVNGCAECVDMIDSIKAESGKPMVAYTDGLMCSAAYWLSAGADYILATKTATIGSIGCLTAHLDATGAYDQMGLKIDVIRSGQHKAAGAYNTSLTSEQRMLVQDEINAIAEQFANYAFENRGSVPIDGRTVIGYDSVAVGLADELVGDLQEAVRLFKSKNKD